MRLGIDFGTTRIVVAAADRGNYPIVTFDGPDGTSWDDHRDRVADLYRADAAFFAEVERAMPGGAVFTLPYVAYPETIAVGKLSGAVGTYAHLPPEIEAEVCRQLDLQPAAVASQVIQRDRHAELVTSLAITAASLEKFALEIRGLQKTEIGEVEEPFAKGQKGSSAMPHKRNPIGCEQIVGLARLVRGNAHAALENRLEELWSDVPSVELEAAAAG